MLDTRVQATRWIVDDYESGAVTAALTIAVFPFCCCPLSTAADLTLILVYISTCFGSRERSFYTLSLRKRERLVVEGISDRDLEMRYFGHYYNRSTLLVPLDYHWNVGYLHHYGNHFGMGLDDKPTRKLPLCAGKGPRREVKSRLNFKTPDIVVFMDAKA
ncbi:hypothetical protein NPIL_249981 [Nephila pilipes]|uniref:Uncharacterized protein n=1 Tax=Nephila pilipes TaxID=299642 RepID=A0A8X6MJU6_NEPPI|nr:hypothetical protein NPIL_249981 [Nephila pilipes]